MVNVAVVGPNFSKRWKFELDKTVAEVLDEVVVNRNQRSTSFIPFMGKILPETAKLCDVPKMKDEYTLHIMRKTENNKAAVKFDNTKFRDCRKLFKKLNNSRRLLEMLNANLREETYCTIICEKFPALKEDRTAYRLYSDLSLCNIFLQPSNDCKPFFEKHPILVEVCHYMLTETIQRAHSNMNNMVSSNFGTSFLSPFGMDGEQASSSAQASGTRQLITPSMLHQAMADALSNTQSFTPPAGSQSVSGTSSSPYATQLAELESLGFTDVDQNRTALDATNGDVGQAIELLIVMRESMQD